MTRTVPSAKQMEDSRKVHYFRDADDNRLVVTTHLLPDGKYGAHVGEAYGYGSTMMEAIADLAAMIEENAE